MQIGGDFGGAAFVPSQNQQQQILKDHEEKIEQISYSEREE